MFGTSRTMFTPGVVDRHDEHRGALVRRRVRVGDGHDDEEVCDRAVRGEPLVPGEDVAAVGRGRRACGAASGRSPRVSGSVIENADFSSPLRSG